MSWSSFSGGDTWAPVRVGLILNPHSRINKGHVWEQEAKVLLGKDRVCCTRGVDEIPDALAQLLDREAVTLLAISGGDGTVHHVLNALLTIWRRQQQETKETLTLPPILLLCGGTLNLVAHSLSIHGTPFALLKQFLETSHRMRVGELLLHQQRILRLDSERWGVRFGFVFGSSLTARCLELYDDKWGGGYVGLGRFLFEAIRGFACKTSLWKEVEPYLLPPHSTLTVDENQFSYIAAVASTIDIKILRGLIKGLIVEKPVPGTMRLRLVEDVKVSEVIRRLPELVLGREAQGIVDLEAVKSIELSGDFSLDGETYMGTTRAKGDYHVEVPMWTIPFVSGRFFSSM